MNNSKLTKYKDACDALLKEAQNNSALSQINKDKLYKLLVDRCETEELKSQAIELYHEILKTLINEHKEQ